MQILKSSLPILKKNNLYIDPRSLSDNGLRLFLRQYTRENLGADKNGDSNTCRMPGKQSFHFCETLPCHPKIWYNKLHPKSDLRVKINMCRNSDNNKHSFSFLCIALYAIRPAPPTQLRRV